jgi:hypothetical protein
MRKIFGFVYSQMKRPVEHAAKAVVHVATSGSLAQLSVGYTSDGYTSTFQIMAIQR